MTLDEKADELVDDKKRARIETLRSRLEQIWREEKFPPGKLARIQGYGIREYFLVSGDVDDVIEWVQRNLVHERKQREL